MENLESPISGDCKQPQTLGKRKEQERLNEDSTKDSLENTFRMVIFIQVNYNGEFY